MRNALIRQVQFVPLPAMVITMLAAVFVPHYASMAQHISELGILAHPAARVMPVAAMAAGASVVLFAVGLWRHPSRAFRFTPVAATVFGISFFSAGIFPTGTGLHGLHGLTMFYVLVPACFAAELPNPWRTRRVVSLSLSLSLAAAGLLLLYMWGMLSGLEPEAFRGLTQRIAILVIFGWYPFAAAFLLRQDGLAPRSSVARPAD